MTEQRLSRRASRISPFLAMEIQTRARQLEAEGRDVIHLEIGEPDFSTPEPVLEAAQKALQEQRMFYTSALGLPELRRAIADDYDRRFGVKISPERIVVTAGSSAALLLSLGALLDEGEEMLLADPSYPCNRNLAHTFGAVPRAVPVGPEQRYQLTADLCREYWSDKTGVILVASPSNPTGTLIAETTLRELIELARERGAALVVDEIYQGLVYEGRSSTALALSDELFVVNSFSKYFQMTGWRLGWLVAPERYVRQLEKLAQNLFISPSTIAQYAALAAFLPETQALLEERRLELDARRTYLLQALPRLGFEVPVTPEGAFYVYADSSRLGDDSFELCQQLLEVAGVAITPGLDFGSNAPEKHVRVAYTQPLARLQEAMTRLGQYFSSRA